MDEEDWAIERTLCQLPQVHVFKIPTRMTADGYRAADWPKDSAWTGKLKIVAKGKAASIVLFDDANPAFAVCHVTDDAAIERTLDSGRYFVLRITNSTGRHAFIGIAFNERNDAFDFNVALQEHKKETDREKDLLDGGLDKVTASTRDLSLKEGEKIKISIGAGRSKERKASGSGGLLAPPPSAGLLPKPGSFKAPIAAASASSAESIWDDFGSASSSSATAVKSPPAAADPWGDLGSFGEPSKSAPAPKKKESASGNLLDLDF